MGRWSCGRTSSQYECRDAICDRVESGWVWDARVSGSSSEVAAFGEFRVGEGRLHVPMPDTDEVKPSER